MKDINKLLVIKELKQILINNNLSYTEEIILDFVISNSDKIQIEFLKEFLQIYRISTFPINFELDKNYNITCFSCE